MSFKVTFEGGKELEKALLEIKTPTAKALVRRVLKRSGQPVAELMNALAPANQEGLSGDGPLNESYTVSTKLNKSQAKQERKAGKDDVFMYIGTNDVAGPQQEFGNERHGAQPHARPAWEAKKFGVLDDIIEDMTLEVEKAAKRAARKAARNG